VASHRRSPQQSPVHPAGRVVPLAAVAAAGAAAAVAVLTPGAATAAPGPDARHVRAEVHRLYTEAERATEQYDGARERRRHLQHHIDTLRDRMARGQDRLNRMRTGLAAVAGAQYRGGAIDPALQLLLSSDPDDYLDRVATLDLIGGQRAGELHRVRQAERRLDQQRAEATRRLGDLARVSAELAGHKRSVRHRLAAARRLLAALPEPDRERVRHSLAQGPGRRASRAARPLPAPGGWPAAPSHRAAAAVAAVRSALGSPYSWASAGPHTFDCSGLMYWAYRHAGITLPRTSQGQLHAGHHIPLSVARPGDLVIYRNDASHVAMYMGGGLVIHAPYPGATVRYDKVDMLPIAAVTRI
jgi:peptidoglycan DL-endopeptidase CwlO